MYHDFAGGFKNFTLVFEDYVLNLCFLTVLWCIIARGQKIFYNETEETPHTMGIAEADSVESKDDADRVIGLKGNQTTRLELRSQSMATNGYTKLNFHVASPNKGLIMSKSDTGLSDHVVTVDDKGYVITELQSMMKPNSEDKEDTAEDPDDKTADSGPIPIDRGWAWMVLLGATLEMTIVIGILKTSGIFFVNFQKRFNSTSSMTSLLSTVQNGVYSVAALLVMTVGVRFLSGRKFNMIGGTVLCICYIISSRLEDIRLLLLTHGVLQGLGLACMQPIALVMVGSYFDKRRGFANSLAVSGGSLGGLILAPLLTTLFENYGYSGAMLITAALFLNGWVTGALFRPQTFYTKRQKNVQNTTDDGFTDDTHEELEKNCISASTAMNGNLTTNGNIQRKHVLKRQHSLEVPQSPISPLSLVSVKELWIKSTRMRAETFSEGDGLKHEHKSPVHRRLLSQTDKPHTASSISLIIEKIADSKIAKYTSSDFIAGSLTDIPFTTGVGNRVPSVLENRARERRSVFKTIAKILDVSLFKSPVFLAYTVAAGLLCASNALVTVYVAPHAKENGMSASDVATLITIYSAIDFCSRIIVGVISDKGWLRRSTIIGISAIVIGLAAHLVRFYTSYKWFLFYAVILGLFSGVYFSLFAVVIVDYMTLTKLQSCLGFTTLFHGAGVSCGFAIIGVLRDSSGSYVVPFHLLGTTALVGGVIMMSLPYIEKYYNKHKSREKS